MFPLTMLMTVSEDQGSLGRFLLWLYKSETLLLPSLILDWRENDWCKKAMGLFGHEMVVHHKESSTDTRDSSKGYLKCIYC